MDLEVVATLKGLRRCLSNRKPVATPSGLRKIFWGILFPGFQSKPWAGISQRFQRYVSVARGRCIAD